MKIFLIGYRACGKTTIGKLLASHLKFDFIDTDKIIERNIGKTIKKFVQTHGWKNFRELEKQVLFSTKKNKNAVIATGGGIIENPCNQEFIKKNGFCVWIDADIKTIIIRLKNDNKTLGSRPALTDKDLFEETNEILKKRKPIYKNTSNIRIDTSFHTPEEIVNIIDRRLKNVRQ